jgi:Flp pilus assembly protein TadG
VRRMAERGSLMLEAALAFPALILAVLMLLQFALWAHSVNVVDDACAYGVRQAAEVQSNPAAVAATTQSLLRSGLGDYAAGFAVRVQDQGAAVAVDVRGSIPILLPLPGGSALPVHAHLVRPKEGVYSG